MEPVDFTIAFFPENEGGYTVIVEELPEAISYGETMEEARENIDEAIQLVLATRRDLSEKQFAGKNIIKKEIIHYYEAH